MEIEHDIATQEPMSLNLVSKISTMELKESYTITQEPVFLKTFLEIEVQNETTETKKIAVQIEVEITEK